MSENELVSQTEECLAELPFSLMTTEMVERIWQAGFYEEDGDESEISIQDVKPYLNAMLNFLQCCHRWINDDQDRQKERIGSRAYKVFQPALIQSAMNLLKYWPGLKDLTAKKSKKKSRAKGSRKRKIDEDFSDGNDDLMDTDSNSQDVEYAQSDAVVHFSYSSQDLMIALLQTIDKALAGTNVSLKDFQECFNSTLHSLIELTRLPDRNMSKTFDWILHNSSPHPETVTNLIFKALSRLILPQHGDPKENINKILKSLLPNLLLREDTTLKKAAMSGQSAIPKELLIIQENTTDYICNLINEANEGTEDSVYIFVQHLCVKVHDKAEYRQKITPSIVSNRIFGLDLIQCMLERFAVIVDGLQDNPQDFTASSLLRIIISRCLDKASSVRSKALSAVAACARLECRVVSEAICEAAVSKITVVTKIVDESHEVTERTSARFGGPTSKVNLLDVVKRRMGDEKPGVRKCAIQALESLLSLDLQSMRSEDFSTICDRCRDVSVSVRKQAMLSSTCLLERCLGNEIYRRLWLDGILPLVCDRESSIQEKCLQVLYDLTWNKIVRLDPEESQLGWQLLSLIANHDNAEAKQRACSQWCIGGKISANDVNRLFRQDFDEFKQTSWWLISVTASYITSFNPTLVADFWLDNDDFFGRDDILHCYVLQTISNVANRLPVEKYQLVYSKLQRELQKCRWTPNLISAGITVIHKFSESEMGISKIEIKQWSKAIMQECCKHICRISETRSLEASALDNAINRIFLIGEISMVIPDSVPSAIFSVLQKIVQDNSFSVPHCLRAHAVITLGKLCLQNEELAKNCVSTLAQCLDSSKDGALRNNIIVVMCDLCKRYATLIDAYVLNILACLRDSESLIRKQTLTLVTRLLQEDFLKLRGNTFYCIVVALVDHDSDVRNIAEFCLSNLILSRNPSIFMNNFIECIFSLNDCASHPDYNRIQYRERERKLFSIKGDNGTQRSRRQRIYEFLLSHMPDEQKFHLNAKICQEVLGAFVDETMQLNEMTFNVLKDTFTILRSKEIKLSSMKNNDVNDLLDEGDLAGAAIATAKSKILTQVTRKNTIENIVPIIVAVKKQLETIRSPLLRDMMLYLKELTKDYRNELNEILVADKQLAEELTYDLNRFEREEKERRRSHTRLSESFVLQDQKNTSISTPERTNHPNTSINATPRLSARRHNNSFNTPALTPARVRCINRMNNTNSDQLQKTPVTTRRSQEYSSDAVDIPKENERAISTPCGQVSQVSFGTVMSSSMATNKSPMPTKIPLRLYNKEQPIKEQTSNESTDVVYLYSPEQPLPKPRKWNVRQ
ncbi:Condensin-2 complex subunit D3 [Trichoplax sp. H2]|nr:Condensin-2 complex subunit D3 [Trichoplax sp. H2]|eukprot:RDD41814.1 Condensin-2 complex subunit D3 [Trichoplax sp. H2]